MEISDKNTDQLLDELHEATDRINELLPELIARKQFIYFNHQKNGTLKISPSIKIYFERLEHKEVYTSNKKRKEHGKAKNN